MVNGPVYPSVEEIEEFNLLALTLIKVKKADAHKVLSRSKILAAIEVCKNKDGDVYWKATALLIALVGAHAFASGNRRTAFIAAKSFVSSNKGRFMIVDDPAHAKVMRGIRENYYSESEVMEWIKNGKIRGFRRR
jgi:prophage maintenance system killer protein